MRCQKCRLREAVTFDTEVKDGKIRTLFVCQECSLPLKEKAFSRLTAEAKTVLVRAGREQTDPSSLHRVRPALLYFLLEDEDAPYFEALEEAGIDVFEVREETASFLGGEDDGGTRWVSARGFTPILVAARDAARRMGHDFIGPEHLFLGLIESPEPGDPLIMIRLAGITGEIERSLIALAALQS